MKTLLIATDLSENAQHAATYGYRLAQQLRAKILICHVMNVPAEVPQTGMITWPTDVYEDMLHESNKELHKLKKQLIADAEAGNYEPEIICLHEAGFVTDVINELAVSHHADMILTGIHGNNRLTTLMIGNHSQKLIEASVRPILLIPAGVAFKPVEKIVLGYDPVELEKNVSVINELVILAKPLTAELILAHVHQRHDVADYILTGKHLQEELIAKFDYKKIKFTVVKNDQVEDGLNRLIHDEHIDLLAMVHQDYGFFKRLFKGSHVQKAAHGLSVPLFVLKPNNQA
jgi:nucleotide-binding universal stress UspA family protein